MDANELRKKLHYDCETGIFTWIESNSTKIKTGQVAGNVRNNKYIYIKINKKLYSAHRLAWIYTYGYIPNVIDHINGNPSDNKIINLRECTFQENMCNRKINSNNKSGSKGVYWHKNIKKWAVSLQVNNKRKHIGYFDDLEFATFVAEEARDKYHKQFARNK